MEKKEAILSPWTPTMNVVKIKKSDLEKIKTMLGVECVYLMIQDKVHDCVPTECNGHVVQIRQSGFTDQMIMGMAHSLLNTNQHVHGDQCPENAD